MKRYEVLHVKDNLAGVYGDTGENQYRYGLDDITNTSAELSQKVNWYSLRGWKLVSVHIEKDDFRVLYFRRRLKGKALKSALSQDAAEEARN